MICIDIYTSNIGTSNTIMKCKVVDKIQIIQKKMM